MLDIVAAHQDQPMLRPQESGLDHPQPAALARKRAAADSPALQHPTEREYQPEDEDQDQDETKISVKFHEAIRLLKLVPCSGESWQMKFRFRRRALGCRQCVVSGRHSIVRPV